MTDTNTMNTATYTWVVQFSQSLSVTTDATVALSGHTDSTVNASTGAFVFCNLIIIVLSTLYMVWRVYKMEKYLTESFKKDYQIPLENPRMLEVELKLESQEPFKEAKNGKKEKEGGRDLSVSKQSSGKGGKKDIDLNEIEVDFDDENPKIRKNAPQGHDDDSEESEDEDVLPVVMHDDEDEEEEEPPKRLQQKQQNLEKLD